MDPLVWCYIHQADRSNHDDMGPIYTSPPLLQRGYGIGRFFGRAITIG